MSATVPRYSTSSATFPNYSILSAVATNYGQSLSLRVYTRLRQLFRPMIERLLPLTTTELRRRFQEQGLETALSWLDRAQQERQSFSTFVVTILVREVAEHNQTVSGRDYLLLEDLYQRLHNDNEMLTLLQIEDPASVLEQEVTVKYGAEPLTQYIEESSNEGELLIKEEALAALALVAEANGERVSFSFFPGTRLENETTVAQEFQRHRSQDSYTYLATVHLSNFTETLHFNRPEFVQGVNTYILWMERERQRTPSLERRDITYQIVRVQDGVEMVAQ